MRRVAYVVALAAIVSACSLGSSGDQNATSQDQPVATFGQGGISGSVIQLRRWKWNDVVANLGKIKDAGYTAVLLSPHTATCSGAFGGDGYDPSDFRSFDSGFGSEGDLANLIRSAHGAGIQVYADMIVNHMCTHGDYRYDRFSFNDFHHNGSIQDWNDQWQLENDDLFGLNDLAQESDYVRGELFNYIVKTNNLGFDGYRWDAVKHVPLWYWRDHVVSNTNNWGKYSFGEVYDANLDKLRMYAGAGMAVTDYNLYFKMKDAFTFGGDLSSLDGAGFAAENGAMALTFVENQDVGAPANRLLSYAFLSGYVGYPLYSNVDINDHDINNLVWVHKNRAFGPYVNRWKEHDVFIFERQGSLIVGLNQSGSWQQRWVDTSWTNTQLHDYSGHQPDTWTAGDNRVSINIPPGSYVMYAK